MKLFVTGATGFIGSHFVNHAHEAGHELVCLRRSPESKPRIELQKQPQWIDAQLDEVPQEALDECEAVIHLAAHSANVPYDTLENCLRWNVLAPLALFRTAIAAGIDRFIVAGSCFEYGRAGERYEFIPTNAPLEPTQSYPASKAAASIVFSQLAIEENLRLSIHRIFQVYGEGETETRFWPSMRRAALEGEDFEMSIGSQVRDFIHVSEVVNALVRAVERTDVLAGQPLIENIASGQARSLRDFAEACWQGWNAKGKLLVGAKPPRRNDIQRFAAEVPTVSAANR
ncbi:MAG: NAD(P)-dependent oxidoreductase [bacterium]|nr:NAD(P)-dependent oxidoreductase [bacterium]